MMTEGVGDTIRRAVYAGKVRLHVSRSNSEIERAFGVSTGPTPAQYGMALGAMGTATVVAMFVLMGGAGPTEVREANAIVAGATAVTESRPVESAPAVSAPVVEEEPVDLLSIPPTDASLFAGVDLGRLPDVSYDIPHPDPNAPYTVVVDKSRKELLVLEETRENYRVVERYPVSIGPKAGDKFSEGDLATPEGLYQVMSIKEGSELPGKYGPRAFVLNYPNKVDRAAGKSGYGIWIHGSGLGLATDDTEGCVEVNDENVLKLVSYVTDGTPVYIFPDGYETPVENGAIQKNLIRPETVYGLKEYRNSRMASLNAGR